MEKSVTRVQSAKVINVCPIIPMTVKKSARPLSRMEINAQKKLNVVAAIVMNLHTSVKTIRT